jgi:Uncharacterized protein conserved in bacteria (DUF2314)
MSHEPISNISLICGSHNAVIEDTSGVRVGDYVKKRFPVDPGLVTSGAQPPPSHELMWVQVTAVQEETLDGTLANEPAFIPDLVCGQQVQVQRSEVVDILAGPAGPGAA